MAAVVSECGVRRSCMTLYPCIRLLSRHICKLFASYLQAATSFTNGSRALASFHGIGPATAPCHRSSGQPIAAPCSADIPEDYHNPEEPDFMLVKAWLGRQRLLLAKSKLPPAHRGLLSRLGAHLTPDPDLVEQYKELQVSSLQA